MRIGSVGRGVEFLEVLNIVGVGERRDSRRLLFYGYVHIVLYALISSLASQTAQRHV